MNFFWNLDAGNRVLMILAVIALTVDRIVALCEWIGRRRKEGRASATSMVTGTSDSSSHRRVGHILKVGLP